MLNIYQNLFLVLILSLGVFGGVNEINRCTNLPEDEFLETKCRKLNFLFVFLPKNKPVRQRAYWMNITGLIGIGIYLLIVVICRLVTDSFDFIYNPFFIIYLCILAGNRVYWDIGMFILVKNRKRKKQKGYPDKKISEVYQYKIPSTQYIYREIPINAEAGDLYNVSIWVNMRRLEWDILSKYSKKNNNLPDLPLVPKHCQLKVNTVYSNNIIVETAKVDADAFQFDWQCISDTFVLKNEQPQGVTIKALQIVLHFENSPYHTSVTGFSLTKVE